MRAVAKSLPGPTRPSQSSALRIVLRVLGDLREVQIRALGTATRPAVVGGVDRIVAVAIVRDRWRHRRDLRLRRPQVDEVLEVRLGVLRLVGLVREQSERVGRLRIVGGVLANARQLSRRLVVALLAVQEARVAQAHLHRLRIACDVAGEHRVGFLRRIELLELRQHDRGLLGIRLEADRGPRLVDGVALLARRLRGLRDDHVRFGQRRITTRQLANRRVRLRAIRPLREQTVDLYQRLRLRRGPVDLRGQQRLGFLETRRQHQQRQQRVGRDLGLGTELGPQACRFDGAGGLARLHREFGGATGDARITRLARELQFGRIGRFRGAALRSDLRHHQLEQRGGGQRVVGQNTVGIARRHQRAQRLLRRSSLRGEQRSGETQAHRERTQLAASREGRRACFPFAATPALVLGRHPVVWSVHDRPDSNGFVLRW